MAEIETDSGPAGEPPMIDRHETKSVHSSNDEKPSPSYEHEHEHGGDEPAPETEELGDTYDPNVYTGASHLSSAPC